MMYSIKMRCSKGGPHEDGGRHISGAERILREDEIEEELKNSKDSLMILMITRMSRMNRRRKMIVIQLPIKKKRLWIIRAKVLLNETRT